MNLYHEKYFQITFQTLCKIYVFIRFKYSKCTKIQIKEGFKIFFQEGIEHGLYVKINNL